MCRRCDCEADTEFAVCYCAPGSRPSPRNVVWLLEGRTRNPIHVSENQVVISRETGVKLADVVKVTSYLSLCGDS